MQDVFYIGKEKLTWADIQHCLRNEPKVELNKEAKETIQKTRQYLDDLLEKSDDAYYGINTGFGSLHNVKISKENLSQLQANLVMSHACGMGDEVPTDIIRLMLVFKAKGLSQGYSGVQVSTVERLLEFYNKNIIPVVYELGSLGASGDLAPLAHLSLPMIGKGKVWNGGIQFESKTVLDIAGVEPLTLQAKEGLALLNGTQFMSSYGAYCVLLSRRLFKLANLIACISIDGFGGKLDPFNEKLHKIRIHKGQQQVSKEIRTILSDSELVHSEKEHVQDPYSFRCIPQVHGAVYDTLEHVSNVILNEVNAVTDNPNIFAEEGEIISGGNFHGQPIAFALDFLTIAMSEIGSISEKRIYKLLEGKHGLPAFLVANSGLNSGFMIPQYLAASIASQNKQYTVPASTDSIVSCNGQEDHVSMGANAATKCLKVLNNIERILAVEFMTAMQALEFRTEKSASKIEALKTDYRKVVSKMEEDRVIHVDLMKTVEFLRTIDVDEFEGFSA